MFFETIRYIAAALFVSLCFAPASAVADCSDLVFSSGETIEFQQRSGLTFSGRIAGKYLGYYFDGKRKCVQTLDAPPKKQIAEMYRELASPDVRAIPVARLRIGPNRLLLDIFASDTGMNEGDINSYMVGLGQLLMSKGISLDVEVEEETTSCSGADGFKKVEVTLVTARTSKRRQELYMAGAYYEAHVHAGFSETATIFRGYTRWQAFKNPEARRYPRDQVCGILKEFGTKIPAQRLMSGL